MLFGLKNKNDTIENTPINTTTKSMNEEKEKKTSTLTPLRRKTEKESIFKMEEPAQISYSVFRDKHNEKTFNIGSEVVLLSVASYVGATIANAARISILTEVFAYVSFFSMLVGISIVLIALFRELRT